MPTPTLLAQWLLPQTTVNNEFLIDWQLYKGTHQYVTINDARINSVSPTPSFTSVDRSDLHTLISASEAFWGGSPVVQYGVPDGFQLKLHKARAEVQRLFPP